jgi:hypothetical protein
MKNNRKYIHKRGKKIRRIKKIKKNEEETENKKIKKSCFDKPFWHWVL